MSFKAVSTESYQIAETQHLQVDNQEKIYGLKLYPNYTKTTRH